MLIKFFVNECFINIATRKKLKSHILKLFEKEQKPLFSLTYIFCSDEYLFSINKKFLQHNDYTDIITFCLSNPRDPIVGEIYISVDRVKDNAKTLNVNTNEELHRVIFHGALHLCGYLDKSISDKLRMRAEENRNLELYFQ